ncbi:MAG: hypothetical protein Q8R02_18740 [Hyphomonadaceae bacterium]|nr:hypothetical protein [Hyphomonadaceae bacterium]
MTEVPRTEDKAGDLAAKLRAMVQGRDPVDIAQFEFIGLEEIAAAYGERWPANKARIHGIAEDFLQRRMDSGDVLIKAASGFVMVFGSRMGAEAQAAAGSLTHGLNEFFLGQIAEIPTPRFGVTTHVVGVKELTESLGDAAFAAPAPAPAEPVEVTGLSHLDWRFQPVWDVKRETLSSWYVTPYLKTTASRVPGYLFESVAPGAVQFAAIDEASLSVSEQALQHLRQQNKQALVGVSLHASSLTNLSTRQRLLSAIDRLDRQFFRYRLLKIAGVAPGFPRLYLNEIVSALRTRIPNIVIGAAWDEPDMAGLLSSGAVAVGVALPTTITGSKAIVPTPVFLRKLAADLQTAHAARVRFFVEGLIERELTSRIALSGVDNICSPRIWPACGVPDGMLKWPAALLAA